MKNALGILVSVVLLLLSSCGEPQGPPAITSAEELAGIWRTTTRTGFEGQIFRQYTEDGSYRMGSSRMEIEELPRVVGRFWFEDGQVVVQDTAGIPGYDQCVEGEKTGTYDLEVLENGHIRFVVVEDECAERTGMLGAVEMERVE